MKSFHWLIIAVPFILSACGGWGDYIHKSDRFDFKLPFPYGWAVWDRSDDRRDFLVADLDEVPGAKITVIANPVAPDLGQHEIYPGFMAGRGDAAILPEFRILDKGTIACKNSEGRFVRIQYMGETQTMAGFRVMFIGDRFTLEIDAEMPVKEFVNHDMDFKKMIEEVKL